MVWRELFRRKPVAAICQELDDASLDSSHVPLTKNLNLFDLVCFGIAAIVGAGIFSTIGSAAESGGPAVSLLFVLTATTCLFSALCYAEFAARLPVSGSAYTYSYAAFGELVAWIIGWDLLMEYAIGNSVIAFSWSEYFSTLLNGLHIDIPNWLETDYYSCERAFEAHAVAAPLVDLPGLLVAAQELKVAAETLDEQALQGLPAFATVQSAISLKLDPNKLLLQSDLLRTWNEAPNFGGMRIILDLPAILINVLVTCLVYIGIKESKTASNLMVILKIMVVLLVIVVGAFYVKPDNWMPFAPNGTPGVLKGIAAVFFAFIGFDAISTTAEECKNPQRDLPRATVLTLIICTVLYVAIALVLTGMVSYRELGVADPLAFVFERYHLNWLAGLVSLSAIIAITSVFLVFQIGQPRIWMSMARDGLLPRKFASIHPRYKTPAFATVMTGFVVALPILFLNQELVTDLCSIGTLFAFMLVSAGVLMFDRRNTNDYPSFRVPYVSGQIFVPALWLAYSHAMFFYLPSSHNPFVGAAWEKFPYLAFYFALAGLSIASFIKKLSLIPVLGILTNLYLIAGLGHHNWMRFVLWLLIGLAVYAGYGFWNSRLRNQGD